MWPDTEGKRFNEDALETLFQSGHPQEEEKAELNPPSPPPLAAKDSFQSVQLEGRGSFAPSASRLRFDHSATAAAADKDTDRAFDTTGIAFKAVSLV